MKSNLIQIVVFGLSLTLLVGCGPPRPITEGFHKALPQRHARIVVWGDHPSATGMAATWLQRRGLTILEPARVQQVLDQQAIRLTGTVDDEAQVLRVAKQCLGHRRGLDPWHQYRQR